MLRRLGIRGKVLAALSVPVLVLFILAGTVSFEALREVQTARTVTTLLTSLQHARGVSEAMQAERRVTLPLVSLATAPFDAGIPEADVEAKRPAVYEAREATIAAVERLENSLQDVDLDVLDPAIKNAVFELLVLIPEIEDVRSRVDAANVPMATISSQYTRVIDEITAFPAAVAEALPDRRLAAILTAGSLVAETVESYDDERSFGLEILKAEVRTDAELLSLATRFPASDIAHDRATRAVAALELGEDVVVPPLGASFNGNRDYASYRTLVGTGVAQNVNFVLPDLWETSSTQEIEAFSTIGSELRSAATDRATEVSTSAVRTALLTIGLALAAVALSILTALAIARQIVNPLRRLTEAAGTVREELPRLVDQVAIPGQGPDLTLTRIPVTSKDEIGQLAAAFNDVNETTIQVAQEQAALRGSIAEMFVNVARRDQVLLNRQLSFIDALERSEEDPKTLADLFRLDHLATRMRRNAESLLVLAGIDTGRRLREALPLSDVIRTASSEIEHYERVQLDLPVDPLMLGHTALPAAHMMAELLENATVFSEPGTPVQVSTGADGESVIITILDQGLGMTTEELENANRKIRAVSAGDVLGSQRLGMFVVGRIAARLGASVELSVGPNGGTLATIRMPQVLFADSASLPRTMPSLPAAAPAAPAAEVPTQPSAPVVAPEPALAAQGLQDVAPGALGSAENPAREVDLGALTDGTTGLGLPRRRRGEGDAPAAAEQPAPVETQAEAQLRYREIDDAAAKSSIPLAPAADALAGAASSVPEGTWQPPVIEPAKPLPARRGDALPSREPAATGGLPTRTPSGSGLPTREPAATTGSVPTGGLPTRTPAAPALPTRTPSTVTGPVPTAGSTAPVPTPEARSGMFSGFRSRRAELAAAAIHVDSGDHRSDPAVPSVGGPDGAERLAAAAATASFFGKSGADEPEAPPVPLVIPSFVDDDDEPVDLTPVVVEAEELTAAAAEPVYEPVAEPVALEAEPWAPAQPVVEQPWAPVPVAEPVAEAPQWAPEPVAEAAPVWAPEPRAGVGAPAGGARGGPREPVAEAAPVWAPGPVADAPQWAPEPVAEAVTEAPAWTPEPVAEAPQWAPEPVADAPQWAPEPVAEAPAWAPEPVAEAPQWAPEPVAEQPWAPVDEPVAEVPAWSPEPVAEQPWAAQPVAETPAWAPVPAEPAAEQAWSAAPAAEAWDATPVDAPAAEVAAAAAPLRTRRDARPEKKRRRLFGRRAAEVARPAAVLTPAPVVEPAPLSAELPTVAPVRQSAWSSTETGAHAAVPAPSVPQPAPAPVEPQPVAAQPLPFVDPDDVPYSPAAFQPGTPLGGGAPVAQPVADVPAWQPAQPPVQPLPERPAPVQAGWQPTQAAPQAPAQPAAWAPTPAWSAPEAPAAPAAPRRPASVSGFFGGAQAPAHPAPAQQAPVVPTQQTGPTSFQPQTFHPAQTTFTPQMGAFDDEVTNALAQRADVAQQALAELSQLSSYRPKAVSGAAPALVRRTPGTVPAAPEIELKPAGERVERDANQVRSLLSSFQSGTSRGRQASGDAAQAAPQTAGVVTHAGHEDGPVSGHGEPVTTPDTDLTQRTTSW